MKKSSTALLEAVTVALCSNSRVGVVALYDDESDPERLEAYAVGAAKFLAGIAVKIVEQIEQIKAGAE